MTPAEEIAVIRAGTDPNPHGQAGYLAGVPRLGIPPIRHVDALGLNVYADATGFPNRLGIASSFDRSAYTELGRETGRQGEALGLDLIYGPQVDMARFPSWTRNITTNGEDPYLSSEFAAEEINAIQAEGLMAQVKHVSMYSGQNQNTPSLVGSQAAHELYLPAAEAAVKDGDVSSLMCSYAKFQIVTEQAVPDYACSNANLLNNIVKGQWGLKGFITSDYTGSHATSDIVRGMDNEFATQNLSLANLGPLIDPTSSRYDPDYAAAAIGSATRIVYESERFGLLDNSKIPEAYQSPVPQHGDVTSLRNNVAVDKAAGGAVALRLAEQSGVLLKNEGNALPLSTSETIAAVGPTATLMPTTPGGERSRGFGDRNTFTPLKAMRTAAGTAKVASAPGIDWIGTTVPATALKVDATTAAGGLTRTTTTNDATPVTTTSVDPTVAGNQTNLVRGYRYTWTGYIDVPADDTYQLLLQRPYGTDSGISTAYNGGVRPASAGSVSLSVDGAAKTLANPSGVILPNDFPDGTLASNGQYLGKDNTGTSLALTAGRHQVSFSYNPSLTSAQTPTLRFAWAPLAANTAAAVTAAQTNDKTVLFVNSDSAGSGPSSSATSALATVATGQEALITTVAAAAHAAGHQVVVVMNSGSAVAMPWLDQVDAVLEMWYPGEEGGTATSNLLYGKVNPSGKLPITFPTSDDATPFSGHPERTIGSIAGDETATSIKWNENLNMGYRWFTDPTANTTGLEPLFPFGFGLSYTSFAYRDLSVRNASDGGLDVTFTVTNTGTKAGADSPQVYLGESPYLPGPVVDGNGITVSGFQQTPVKLVQFDHVELAAGASATKTLHVPVRQVSAWDTVGQTWVVGTGVRKVSLGASSEDLVLSATRNVPAMVMAPAVTQSPVPAVSVPAGTTVTLTAAATGTPAPTVQWQVSTDQGATWNAVPGAVATTYSFVAAAAQDGQRFRALFSNDLGSVPTSATALTVTGTTPPPTPGKVTPSVSAKVKPGSVSPNRAAKVKVTVKAPTGATPTGSVKLRLDGAKVAKKSLRKGKVTFTLRVRDSGKHRVRAIYLGDGAYTVARSKTTTYVVR